MNMAVSIIGASVVSIGGCVGSAIYLDKFLGPVLRGTGWEFLALPTIAAIVFGTGLVWWKAYVWIDNRLGGE